MRGDCHGELDVDGEPHKLSMESTAEDAPHLPALRRVRFETAGAVGQRPGAHRNLVRGPVPSRERPSLAVAGDVRTTLSAD